MTDVDILVEHVTKRFGKNRGVTDVNVKVERGQVLGFLGPNGAGKTTTIRCVLGLYRPTSGDVRVLGQDPAHSGAAFLTDVGYLPGELNLPGSMTGRDIITRFSAIRGLTTSTYREGLIERFGAELDRPTATLSTGNKQKLGIVLAFMHRPRLLVLDEPTSGLDPLLQAEFASLLQESSERGQTVLLSSHDLDEVQRVAHRVVIIKAGRIVIDDTVRELRAAAPHTMELTFSHPVDLAPLRAVPGVTVRAPSSHQVTLTYTGAVTALLFVIARLEPEAIIARPADLDELFLRLYAGKQAPDED